MDTGTDSGRRDGRAVSSGSLADQSVDRNPVHWLFLLWRWNGRLLAQHFGLVNGLLGHLFPGGEYGSCRLTECPTPFQVVLLEHVFLI